MAMTFSNEAPVKDVERFQKAMKAWLPVMGQLHWDGYWYSEFEEEVDSVTCNRCKATGPIIEGDLPSFEHADKCPVAQAEAGLETLRKMATGVE